jgi:hypothetical protein
MACLHGLEAAIFGVHPVLPIKAVIDFWRSVAVQQYIEESIERIFRFQAGDQLLAMQLRYEVNKTLAAYIRSLEDPPAWTVQIPQGKSSQGYATSESTAPSQNDPLENSTKEASPVGNVEPTVRKKRGRPVQIPDERKERALAVKGGKERAKIIYNTRYPTAQQKKNVSAILKNFSRNARNKTHG